MHVATTPATTHDVKLTDPIQRDLAAKHLTPQTHLVEGGYLEADVLMSSRQQGIDLIGPVPADKSWQATTEGALDHAQFQIDWDRKQATCPAGKTSTYSWKGPPGAVARMCISPSVPPTAMPAPCRPNARAPGKAGGL